MGCVGLFVWRSEARKLVSPFRGEANEVHLVPLDEALGSIVPQNNAGEVSSALFFYQQTGSQRQPAVAREELI